VLLHLPSGSSSFFLLTAMTMRIGPAGEVWCHHIGAELEGFEERWCLNCEMWLNGPAQMADHLIGSKHRKTVRKQNRAWREFGAMEAWQRKCRKPCSCPYPSDATRKT
jgi:hypothetical protein